MTRVAYGVLLAAMATGLAACSAPRGTIPLTPGFDSAEAAATAVVDALWHRDIERLRRLPVSESEFKKHIWPTLPAAREAGTPPDYHWAEQAQKNAGYLGSLVADHAGKRMVVREVRFLGSSTDEGAYRLHRKTELLVEVDGARLPLRLFGSMIESGGLWKIYSYIVD